MQGFNAFLASLNGPVYAIFRIMTALLFMQHGTQKILGFPSEFPWPLNAMSTTAGWIELVAGLLIAIGLFTRLSAFIASGMAAVGYWMVHATQSFFPIDNGGEIIALYCFSFLLIATQGAGIWSVDGARSDRR